MITFSLEKKEKSSRVVLISRTTINNSTVSGIQAERKVNLRLLDNAPIGMHFLYF